MGQLESSSERTSAVAVERGLYILRYASAQDEKSIPIAEVTAAAGFEDAITVISAPQIPLGKLNRPGACAVVRAEKPGQVKVTIRARTRGGSLDASFRLESLTSKQELEAWDALAAEEKSARNPPLAVRGGAPKSIPQVSARSDAFFVAHLAMRGDVEVSGDQWAGGPDSPMPVEGLEIRPSSQAGIQIEMQVLIASRPPRWSEWVPAGVFAGTRGRGLALTGVRLRLQGRSADSVELLADAVFLGSVVTSKRGREVELVSATGAEPMVGIRLGLRVTERAASPLAVVTNRESSPRVRVFRASTG